MVSPSLPSSSRLDLSRATNIDTIEGTRVGFDRYTIAQPERLFRFGLGASGRLTVDGASLGDYHFDVEVIRDRNRNNRVDSGEVLGIKAISQEGQITLDNLRTGNNYYLRVKRNDPQPDPNGSPFSFKLTPDFAGSTLMTARMIGRIGPETKTYQDVIQPNADSLDLYSFRVTQAEKVNLTLSNLDADLTLEILDKNGTPIAQSAQLGRNVDEQIVKELQPGRYFARVRGADPELETAYTLTIGTGAPANPLEWVRQFGEGYVRDSEVLAKDVAIDAAGNAFVVGDGLRTGATERTGFIAKFDRGGKLLWKQDIDEGPGDDQINAVAIDAGGNLYLGGERAIPYGNRLGTSASRAFVAKYDAKGTRQWSTPLSAKIETEVADLVVDRAGNVYATGSTFESREFSRLQPGDVWVGQVNGQGKQQWIDSFGEKREFDKGAGIALDSSGSVYLTGALGDAGSLAVSNSFLAKYSNTGQRAWVRNYNDGQNDGFPNNAEGREIVIDSKNSVYLVGSFIDDNAVITKHNSNGDRLWSGRLPNSFSAGQASVATDLEIGRDGSVYVAGENFPREDANNFIARFDSQSGRFMETIAKVGDPNGFERSPALGIDAQNNLYLASTTFGTLPGQTNFSGRDAFLAKFRSPSAHAPTKDLGDGIDGYAVDE